MDYFSILNLNKEPFSNSPDPEYFFHSHQHVGCIQKLELSLRLRRGLNVVIGDVGTGKTTLCRQLIRKFRDEDTIETHLILDPHFTTPHEFLSTVAEMLSAEKVDQTDDDYQLKERIKKVLFKKGVEEQKTTVLIIDEGQKIPDFCLEVLREFLNYETNDYKLLQIAIFAQTEFDNTLKQLANFADRINLYHRLEPMGFKDSKNMIQFRLNQSSAAAQKLSLFTYPALWAIYRATRGYPRKIVNLCHRSILTMIIQNKSKANWFLVQSCMKRAFEGPRSRSWVSVTLVAACIAAGIVLVPRFLPERIPFKNAPAPVSDDGESYRIAGGAQQGATPVPVSSPSQTAEPSESHAGQAQAAKPGREPSASPALEPAAATGTGDGYVQASTAPDAPPPQTGSSEKPVAHQRPKVLGQLTFHRKETLGGMIQSIYGIFNSQYLYAVVEMNPHLTDPDTIDIGEVVVFPAIPLRIKAEEGQKRWWIELYRRDALKDAFDLLRNDRQLAQTSRLIPHWEESSGLQFSIISNGYYYDEETARARLSDLLASRNRPESRLLPHWNDATVFYANPYLGP